MASHEIIEKTTDQAVAFLFLFKMRDSNPYGRHMPRFASKAGFINTMKMDFAHPTLAVQKDKPLVYTVISKHLGLNTLTIAISYLLMEAINKK